MKAIVRALLAFVVSLVRSPVSLCVTLRLGLPRPELRMDDGERHTPSAAAGGADRKSTRLNSSHRRLSRMPSSA